MKRKTIIRNSLTIALLLVIGGNLYGQEADVVDNYELQKTITTTFFIIAGVIIAGAIYSVFRFTELLSKNIESKILAEQGVTTSSTSTASVAQKPSLWKQLNQRLTRVVPIEQEEDIMLDHDYDGIRELDNRLPPWWVGMFYVTIAYGIIHILVFWVFDIMPLPHEKFEQQMAKAEIERQAFLREAAGAVNENNVVALTGTVDVELGKSIFNSNCLACHGALGEGTVGPNLTDKFWIHGGGIKNIFKTIKYGVPQKGMIAWQTQLSPVQMQQVASYIMTLEGTNPPNAKAPEGEEYIAEE